MDATETNTTKQKSVRPSDINWQTVGVSLMESELERTQMAVSDEFNRVARILERDGEISADDVRRLRHAVMQADFVVQELEKACEGKSPDNK